MIRETLLELDLPAEPNRTPTTPPCPRGRARRRAIGFAATAAYLVVIGLLTLGPQPKMATGGGLADALVYLAHTVGWSGFSSSTLEFWENIALFAPVGFLMVALVRPRRWWMVPAFGFLLSVGIETAQFSIPGRVPDIRDIVANGLGCAAGAAIAGILVWAVRAARRPGAQYHRSPEPPRIAAPPRMLRTPERRLATSASRRVIAISVVVTLVTVASVVTAVTLAKPGAPSGLGAANTSPDVDAQVSYVLAHWKSRNVAEYGSLGDNDCVNFASQSLIARGWQQTSEWWHADDGGGHHRYSAAWQSSTALAAYLGGHPELAVAVPGSQPQRVRLGDLVQFDWDNSGNRDHTGIVTRILHRDGRTIVEYASHSNDREYQSVGDAIRRDGRGGTYYFWHLRK